LPPLTDEQKKELEVLEAKSEIDYSDIPANLDTPMFPYYFQFLKNDITI